MNHRLLAAFTCAFVYGLVLIFYAFICYFVTWFVAVYASRIAYASLRRRSIHVFRCYCRDLWEGNAMPPHMLRHYISVCILLVTYYGFRSQRFLWDSILIFFYRVLLQDLHYGKYCRLASISNVFLYVLILSLHFLR